MRASCCPDLLSRHRPISKDVEQELLGILQGIAAIIWLFARHQLARCPLQDLAPIDTLSGEIAARDGGAKQDVRNAAIIGTEVALCPHKPPRSEEHTSELQSP